MASNNFDTAKALAEDARPMVVTTDKGRIYEGFFSNVSMDRRTLPAGWHAYDLRDDGVTGIPFSIENRAIVNNFGCFFINGEIVELYEPDAYADFQIDPDEWELAHWNPEDHGGESYSHEAYDGKPAPEPKPGDWDWTFND